MSDAYAHLIEKSFRCDELAKQLDALKSELSAKDERMKELEQALDRFCTLSNGLSIYARDEYQRTRLEMTDSVDLVERIEIIYNYQCDVEHLTQQHTTKGET